MSIYLQLSILNSLPLTSLAAAKIITFLVGSVLFGNRHPPTFHFHLGFLMAPKGRVLRLSPCDAKIINFLEGSVHFANWPIVFIQGFSVPREGTRRCSASGSQKSLLSELDPSILRTDTLQPIIFIRVFSVCRKRPRCCSGFGLYRRHIPLGLIVDFLKNSLKCAHLGKEGLKADKTIRILIQRFSFKMTFVDPTVHRTVLRHCASRPTFFCFQKRVAV